MSNLYRSFGYPIKNQAKINKNTVMDSNSFTISKSGGKVSQDKLFGAIRVGRGRRINKIQGKSGTKSI
jgi:hypothetical protein